MQQQQQQQPELHAVRRRVVRSSVLGTRPFHQDRQSTPAVRRRRPGYVRVSTAGRLAEATDAAAPGCPTA